MKTCIIEPDGWPLKLEECPPGHFIWEDNLCFKSEYENDHAFNSAGEYLVISGGTLVQPVQMVITDE